MIKHLKNLFIYPLKKKRRKKYVSSTLEISIPEFIQKNINGKTITYYIINITNNYSKEKWTKEKRYSEIDLLYKSLSKLLTNIPLIPPKSFFKIHYSQLN